MHLHATYPMSADSDSDGLNDGNELNIHGTLPLNPDSDGDAVSDREEILAASDPLDDSSYPPVSDGDINLDGEVNVADILRSLQLVMDDKPATPAELSRGDVAPLINGRPAPDGEINLGDVLVIQQKVLGNISF